MKTVILWGVRKYALAAVKDAVAAKSDDVAKWSAKVADWLARARLVVAYLERLAARLADGVLEDAEADETISEAKLLANQVLGS